MIPLTKLQPLFAPDWYELLKEELAGKTVQSALEFIKTEYEHKQPVFPMGGKYFSIYGMLPYEKVRVVIVGIEPYHTTTCDEIAFSTEAMTLTPTLENMFTEIYLTLMKPSQKFIDIEDCFCCGDLRQWVNQGVFLLNKHLSVGREKKSHQKLGWDKFTAKTIKLLNEKPYPVVFMLWGKDAQEFEELINPDKHLILKAHHPAAQEYNQNNTFVGCEHFIACNNFLKEHNITHPLPEINWGVWTSGVPHYVFTIINEDYREIERLADKAEQTFRLPCYFDSYFDRFFGKDWFKRLQEMDSKLKGDYIRAVSHTEKLKQPKKDKEWLYDENNFLYFVQNMGAYCQITSTIKIAIE